MATVVASMPVCYGVACLLLACGSGPKLAAATRPTSAMDQAIDAQEVDALFDTLPGEAQHCSFGRVASLPGEIRESLAELLPVERYLWDSRLQVRAFATVAKARGGLQARSAVLRVRAERRAVEEVLSALPRYEVRFGGEPAPCLPESCPLVVRFLAQDLVRLDLGHFVDRGLRSETVHDCTRLAKTIPEATFVMSERVEPTLGAALGPLHVRISVGLRQEKLMVTVRDVYIDQEAAEVAFRADAVHSILRSPVADLTGTVRRSVEGRQMVTQQTLTPNELLQLRSDLEIKRKAHRYGELLAQAHDFDPSASQDERLWLAAIDERLALLEASGWPMPEHPLAREIQSLIAAARASYPESTALSQREARLQAAVRPDI